MVSRVSLIILYFCTGTEAIPAVCTCSNIFIFLRAHGSISVRHSSIAAVSYVVLPHFTSVRTTVKQRDTAFLCSCVLLHTLAAVCCNTNRSRLIFIRKSRWSSSRLLYEYCWAMDYSRLLAAVNWSLRRCILLHAY